MLTTLSPELDRQKMYMGAKALLKSAGFNLRKFNSNSRELQSIVEKEETGFQPQLDPQPIMAKPHKEEETLSQAFLGGYQELLPGEQGVLGVKWNRHGSYHFQSRRHC